MNEREFLDMISANNYVPNENFYRLAFAASLIHLRDERGLSRKELADGTGLTELFIAKCERAKSTPNFEKLYALATFLEVSFDELTGHNVENAVDVLSYRFDRAIGLVEASGNKVDFPDESSVELTVFTSKDEQNSDDAKSDVVAFESHKSFTEFVEMTIERVLAEEKTFGQVVHEVMGWWEREGKNASEND